MCYKCKIVKPISEFHKDKNKSDGLMALCIKCKREYRTSAKYKEIERQLEKTPQYKLRKRRYYKTEKGKNYISLEEHRYRTRNTGNAHDLTSYQWQTILYMQDFRCAICRNPFTTQEPAERDCIIPLSKGGSLTFENTQALCCHCNSKKSTKLYSGLGNNWRAKIERD